MNGKTPHIVQYQGSKRMLAHQILHYMPSGFNRLIEPFAGMAAISIAAACEKRAERFYLNDLNAPLISVLQEAVEHPDRLIESYAVVWEEQFSCGENHVQHFYTVRERFNNGEETAANMLYLLARCVKGAVRYGKNGKFNQSPDKRRHGTHPKTLAQNVFAISNLLNKKTIFTSLDYRDIVSEAKQGDLVYMDPPYQGVSNTRDNRYLAGVSFEEFSDAVKILDRKGIDYIISYDGKCGVKEYGRELPKSLHYEKVMLNAGLSSQSTLLGNKATTFEALYISETLLPVLKSVPEQVSLLEAMA